MNLNHFTLIHVIISLVGIVSGFGALSGWMSGKLFPRWTSCFLVTTVATSGTGFFFPFKGMTPGIVVGIISLVLLGVAIYALYIQRLTGPWRAAFAICSVASLYLNFFVLIAQLFQKFPAFIDIAPSQSEPPFAVTQGIVFLVFIALGIAATRRLRNA
jgi:hypothetical protein